MGIRYFATNRDMERLDQKVVNETEKDPRELRIRLERGGYYFADMADYMAYYLGEVETAHIPHGALVPKSRKEVFGAFLNNPRIATVVICVHGFNVELNEAYTWFRVLTDTMRHNPRYGSWIVTDPDDPEDKVRLSGKDGNGGLTAFIGYSWPSNGKVVDYASDQRDAQASAEPLANLIARLHLAGKTVNLLCHSMGNFLTCHMLASLVKETSVPSAFSELYISREYQVLDKKRSETKAYKAEREESVRVQKMLLDRLPDFLRLIRRGEKAADETVERPELRLVRQTATGKLVPRNAKAHFVERLVMVAPDVERRHITKARSKREGNNIQSNYLGPFYSGLQHLVAHCTNVYSRFDMALTVSNIEKSQREVVLAGGETLNKVTFGLLDFLQRNPDQKWEKRLGEAPHPPNAPPNFSSVNATEIAGRKIDHSDHIDSPEVVARIAEELQIAPE